MENQIFRNLSDIKLDIINGIIKCNNTKENENLLFKLAGYVECLADKGGKK